MSFSLNEKYLLRFISYINYEPESNNELMELICKYGIKLNFKNSNPVYQIIDEMRYKNTLTRK